MTSKRKETLSRLSKKKKKKGDPWCKKHERPNNSSLAKWLLRFSKEENFSVDKGDKEQLTFWNWKPPTAAIYLRYDYNHKSQQDTIRERPRATTCWKKKQSWEIKHPTKCSVWLEAHSPVWLSTAYKSRGVLLLRQITLVKKGRKDASSLSLSLSLFDKDPGIMHVLKCIVDEWCMPETTKDSLFQWHRGIPFWSHLVGSFGVKRHKRVFVGRRVD